MSDINTCIPCCENDPGKTPDVARQPHGVNLDWFLPREGHSSLVMELAVDLEEKPGAIVVSVGGGGLLNGVVEGLRRVNWADVPIVAVETYGAHSLNAAMKAGKPVTLPAITRY